MGARVNFRHHLIALGWSLVAVIGATAAGNHFSTSASSKALSPPSLVLHAHAILRPDLDGEWYIMVDDTHASYGIDRFVQQTDDHVRIYTAGLPALKAGTIQISSDDGFGGVITGHANLGLNTAMIEVRAHGQKINPRDIWEYLPTDRKDNVNGNFWINITMVAEQGDASNTASTSR